MAAEHPIYLFAGGNPRSGTSALRQTLCAHGEVAISDERYNKLWASGEISPGHFAADRFLNPLPTDSGNPVAALDKPDIRGRYRSARVVGDKVAPVWKYYETIFARFPGARVAFILRNPVSMYDSQKVATDDPRRGFSVGVAKSVDEWNQSVRKTIRFIEDGFPISVVPYERLWRSRANVMRLFSALGLSQGGVDADAVDRLVRKAARKFAGDAARNERQREYILLNADTAAYRRLLETHSVFGLDGLDEADDPPPTGDHTMSGLVSTETRIPAGC